MIGVALYAAVRRDVGRELTDLEQWAMTLMGHLAPEEEITALGREYVPARAAGRTQALPKHIASRGFGTGYGLKDLLADVAVLRDEVFAHPTVRIVDLTELGEEPELCREEQSAAGLEYRGVVTVLTHPSPPRRLRRLHLAFPRGAVHRRAAHGMHGDEPVEQPQGIRRLTPAETVRHVLHVQLSSPAVCRPMRSTSSREIDRIPVTAARR
ncbi:hypothetical protein [Streptomyces sp. NPDC056361]|uniref:hypothetical protein n=1 Tax=Streptomyces sp. NPDC056361 TaxID=3345795 RepID=UPI0035D65117